MKKNSINFLFSAHSKSTEQGKPWKAKGEKKMKKRKVFFALGALLFMLGTVTACGNNDTVNDATSGQDSQSSDQDNRDDSDNSNTSNSGNNVGNTDNTKDREDTEGDGIGDAVEDISDGVGEGIEDVGDGVGDALGGEDDTQANTTATSTAQ
jgi:cytoskeletal protein RodZ